MKKAAVLAVLLTSIIFSLAPARAADPPIITTFKVEPEVVTVEVGDTITLDVNVYDAAGLWGWQVDVLWDPTILAYSSHTFGDFLAGQPEGTVQLISLVDVDFGNLMATEITFGNYQGVTADAGWLISFGFEAVGEGETTIAIDSLYTYWLEDATTVWGDEEGEMVKENGYLTAVFVEPTEVDWYEYHSRTTGQGLVEVICFYEDDVTWQFLGSEEYQDGVTVCDTYERGSWDPNFAEPVSHKETHNSVWEDGWFYTY